MLKGAPPQKTPSPKTASALNTEKKTTSVPSTGQLIGQSKQKVIVLNAFGESVENTIIFKKRYPTTKATPPLVKKTWPTRPHVVLNKKSSLPFLFNDS